jgi:hypothetical protein
LAWVRVVVSATGDTANESKAFHIHGMAVHAILLPVSKTLSAMPQHRPKWLIVDDSAVTLGAIVHIHSDAEEVIDAG